MRVAPVVTRAELMGDVKDQDTIDLRCSPLHRSNKSMVLIFTEPTKRTGASLPRKRLRLKERTEEGSTVLRVEAQVLTEIDSRRRLTTNSSQLVSQVGVGPELVVVLHT